jgi:hypothetical protein
MDRHADVLQNLLNKNVLSTKEVLDGVVACFYNTNRAFVRRRLGEVQIEKIDAALEPLIQKVFIENQLDTKNPSVGLLKHVRMILDDQSGFEAEPELLDTHKKVLDSLFSRLSPKKSVESSKNNDDVHTDGA